MVFDFLLSDAWKPGPVRPLQNLPGGWGITADDLAAGFATAAVIHYAQRW